MRSVSNRFLIALVVVIIGAFLSGYIVQTSASSGAASGITAVVPTLRATNSLPPATTVAVSTAVGAPTGVIATTIVPTASPATTVIRATNPLRVCQQSTFSREVA